MLIPQQIAIPQNIEDQWLVGIRLLRSVDVQFINREAEGAGVEFKKVGKRQAISKRPACLI